MADAWSIDLYFLLFGGTITFLLLAVGLFTFLLQYQKRIIKQDLAFKDAEVKHGQELYLGTLEATERERERLARDLHDVIGASLSTMRLQLSDLEHKAAHDPDLKNFSDRNKELIDQTILEVRRISNDLLPPGLEEFGLLYSIEGLCEQVLDFSDIDISLEIKEVIALNKQKSLIMYRIVQELLNNSVKHSEASKINIILSSKDGQFILIFKDNGKGFDYSEAYKKRSLGLKNIEVRAKMIEGSAEFVTKKDEGLKVEIRIPV